MSQRRNRRGGRGHYGRRLPSTGPSKPAAPKPTASDAERPPPSERRVTRTDPDGPVRVSSEGLIRRIIILTFTAPPVVLVLLLETGQRALAGVVAAVLLGLGIFMIVFVRRTRAKEAQVEADRIARREAREERLRAKKEDPV